MPRVSFVLSVLVLLAGCKKPVEPVAAAPGPAKVSIESAGEAALPAPPPAGEAAPPDPASPPAAEAPPAPAGQAISVYDTGTPAQKAAAQKSRRNLAWINVFKSGSDADKQKARKAIDALPAAERTEFVEMIKLYGIQYP